MTQDDWDLRILFFNWLGIEDYKVNRVIEISHLYNDVLNHHPWYFNGSVRKLQGDTSGFELPKSKLDID